jgi:RNA polymerase sigma factor (sigma-70 family)
MRPRQTLIENFSTFLEFQSETAHRWIADPRLRRSIERCLADPEVAEERSAHTWSLYWYQVWQKQRETPDSPTPDSPKQPPSLATAHLIAYLQESCYWSAHHIATHFKTNHTVADFFQTAIAQTQKVLRCFDAKQGASLKTYAKYVFDGIIKNWLREHREIQSSSDWALLNNVSQKRLTDALEAYGSSREALARDVLAWSCFKELYAPQGSTSAKLTKPDEQNWQAIATLYNRERLTRQVNTEANAAQIESWLLRCAKAIRLFQNPPQVSLNVTLSGEADGDERLDLLSDGGSLLTDLIDQEEAEANLAQRRQVGDVLSGAIAALDGTAQALLQAYYQQQLTQQQIAQKLGIKQYTVSRQLTRLRQGLLLTLAEWSQQTLHISLTPSVLDSMSHALEEWLTTHYQSS